jgi:hypothetical protein
MAEDYDLLFPADENPEDPVRRLRTLFVEEEEGEGKGDGAAVGSQCDGNVSASVVAEAAGTSAKGLAQEAKDDEEIPGWALR